MKKNIIAMVVACLLLGCSLASCIVGTGQRIEPGEKRSFTTDELMSLNNVTFDTNGDYTGILACGYVLVHVAQGDSFTVRAEGMENLVVMLAIHQHSSDQHLLEIVLQDKWNFIMKEYHPVDVYITMPRLERVEATNAATVHVETPFTTENFTIKGSGASSLRFASVDCEGNLSVDGSGAIEMEAEQLSAHRVSFNVKGASDVDIKAMACDSVELNVSGASDIECDKLTADHTFSRVSGASDIYIGFENSGTAQFEVSGASDVKLSGTLKDLDTESLGASSIDKKGLKIMGR